MTVLSRQCLGEKKATRGGSWWYGPEQMQADSRYTKPRDFPAIFVGFRCAKDLR